MEITLTIDGKEVLFKSNGAVAKRYMMQFQRDMLKDILSMGVTEKSFDKMSEGEKVKWMRDNIDFNMFYDIAWVFAKTANNEIKDPLSWLESFDEFPILDIIEPLQGLLEKTVSSKKK
ncbi:hypothetical protein U1P98_18660 [Lysinibacillus irui]|uniref:Prophage pi2 protein 40 n=1 Tax=Lysinibacillus irui TaxID=2998077 RepID=A0ABU5NQM8_9BACI|nr:hypothetical protein [Lysinibacillus irui]MEA0556078.1 hypothetical protein [Lysinibacillus irui]MEA0978332.1 hypothetical protein [Lysinibacillus irui]MEA1044486.1 hypothetical protein [Lysinibacillus irui]